MTESASNEMREADDRPKRLLPGRRLRAAREIAQISISEAAGHLRLDPQLITALEEDRYEALPGAAYVCGYLRSYARLLKLPENEIVQAFTHGEDIKSALIPENVNILPPKRVNRRLIQTLLAVTVMIIVVAGLLWMAEQFHLFEAKDHTRALTVPIEPINPSSPPAQLPAENLPATAPSETTKDSHEVLTPPVEESTPEGETTETKPVSKNAKELRLKYNADSWTEVKDANGVRLIFRLVEKNSVITLRGEPPLWVLLGYANGVEVFYQGKRFDHKDFIQNDVAIFSVGKSN